MSELTKTVNDHVYDSSELSVQVLSSQLLQRKPAHVEIALFTFVY